MRKGSLVRLLLVVGLMMVLSLFLLACGGAASTPTPAPTATPVPTATPAPTATPTVALSEKSDEATFKKYFKEIGLGRLPAGKTLPSGLEQNVTVFSPGDNICQYGTIVQTVQPYGEAFDTQAKKVVVPKTQYPQPL